MLKLIGLAIAALGFYSAYVISGPHLALAILLSLISVAFLAEVIVERGLRLSTCLFAAIILVAGYVIFW